jgi:hypothetical protein
MRDITELMQKHRECSRHLWNTYFWPQAETDDDWDLRDRFESIVAELFASLVLWPLEREEFKPTPANWEPLKPVEFIRVVPIKSLLQCPILINREISSGYWDHPVTAIDSADTDMRFIQYFDWSNLGHRDFEFIRVHIARSIAHPEIVGHNALLRPLNVRILFEDAGT